MPDILFNGQTIRVKTGQTVLSALLEQGHNIPNSCRAGVCQSCLIQATEGDVPPDAQTGLKDTLKAQGYFMACSCKPETSLKLVLPDQMASRHLTNVLERKMLSKNVLRLRLMPDSPFEYRPGQFVTIWNSENIGRNYSLASVPGLDEYLEFHIRYIPDGKLSGWLHNEIQVDDVIQIQSSIGNCFYVAGSPDQNLLLAGTGTGLAPLLGIVRDALQQDHTGDIHLIHGAVKMSDLYMHEELQHMSKQHSNFFYHASVVEDNGVPVSISTAPLDKVVMAVVPKPTDWKAYLCGDPGIVNTLKKKLFISGASMSNIYSDPFISPDHV